MYFFIGQLYMRHIYEHCLQCIYSLLLLYVSSQYKAQIKLNFYL